MHQYTNVANQNQSMTCMIGPKRHNSFFSTVTIAMGIHTSTQTANNLLNIRYLTSEHFIYVLLCVCAIDLDKNGENTKSNYKYNVFFVAVVSRVFTTVKRNVTNQPNFQWKFNFHVHHQQPHQQQQPSKNEKKKTKNSFVDRMRNRRVFACSQHEL